MLQLDNFAEKQLKNKKYKSKLKNRYVARTRICCIIRMLRQGAVKHGRGNALISADPCVMRLGNGASARFAKKARRKAKSWRPKEICTALNAPTLTKVRRC